MATLPAFSEHETHPLFYLDQDNNVLCPDCANEPPLGTKVRRKGHVNWEDESLYCDNCSTKIQSAYGDDE